MSDLYQEIILEEYQHPHHFGELEQADVVWQEHNSSCGDQVTIFLKLNKEKNQIEKMSWVGEGCAISKAAASLLSQQLQQKKVSDVLALEKKDIEALLGIDEVVYGREKCLLLALEAVQKSLKGKNE